MARGTIKQRIALDGGAEIRKELLELGRAGEVVWAKLNKLSKQEIVPATFQTRLLAIKGAFNDVSAAGDKFGKALSPINKSARDLGAAVDTMGTKLRNMSLAVTAAVIGFGAIVKAAADSGDAIGENAQKAGVAASEFEKLSFAAKTAGLAPEDLAAGFAKLNRTLTDSRDVAQSLGGAFAPVRSAADLIAQGFGAAGVSVSSLRDKLSGLEGQTLTVKQALQAVGTTLEAFKAQTPTEKLLTLAKGLQGVNSEAAKGAILFPLFGKSSAAWLPFLSQGADGIKKLTDRMQELGLTVGEDGIKALGDLADETDFLGLAFQKTRDRIIAAFAPDLIRASNGFLNWLKENRAEIDKFVIDLKTNVIGIIQDFYNALTGNGLLVNRPWVNDWTKAITDFATSVQTAVTTIIIPAFTALMAGLEIVAQSINAVFGTNLKGSDIGIILVIAKVTGALGTLVPAVVLAANVIKGLVLLFSALSGPVGLISLALVAVAVAIYTNWGGIVTFVTAVLASIKAGAITIGQVILAANIAVVRGIISLVSSIGDALAAGWETVKTGAAAAFQWVQDKARAAVDAIKGFFSADTFAGVFEALKQSASDAWTAIQKGFTDLGAAITKVFTDAIDSVKNLWTGFTGTIANTISNLIGGIRSLIDWLNQAGEAADRNLNSGDPSSSGTGFNFGSGFATGGHVRGRGTSTSDSILSWLSDNEFVVQAKAVRKYGLGFLHAINSGRFKLPGFAGGGQVAPRYKLGIPAFSVGGLASAMAGSLGTLGNPMRGASMPRMSPAGGGLVPVNIHLPGHGAVPMLAQTSALQQLARAAGHKKLTTGGTKPSWYK